MENNTKTAVLHRLLADDGYILQDFNPTHGLTIIRNKTQLSHRRSLTLGVQAQYIHKLMQVIFPKGFPCKSIAQYEKYRSSLIYWVDMYSNISERWEYIKKSEQKLCTYYDCSKKEEFSPEHPLIKKLNAQLYQISQALSQEIDSKTNLSLRDILPFHPTSIKVNFSCNESAEKKCVNLLNLMIQASEQILKLLTKFPSEFNTMMKSCPKLKKKIPIITKYIPKIPASFQLTFWVPQKIEKIEKIDKIEFLNQLCILNNTLVNGVPSCFHGLYSNYCEEFKKGTEESLFQFVWKFCQSIIPFGEYLYFSAARLLMTELISSYHNCHISDLACTLKDDSASSDTASEVHAITVSGFENHFNGIVNFIQPLLSTISLYENIGYDEDFFFHDLRERLLYFISGCTSEKELHMKPPSEELTEDLRFAERSMEFIVQFQSSLEQVSADEQLKICVELFAGDKIKADYHSRQIWTSRIQSKNGKPINAALLLAKNKMPAENAQRDFFNREHTDTGLTCRALTDTLKEGLAKVEQIQVTNYSTITLLALEESIKNYVTHYRFPDRPLKPYYAWCRRCNQMMVKTRKNTFYCLVPLPGKNQSCASLSSHQKNSTKTTPADRIWKSILNKMNYIRDSCPVELPSKTKNLIAEIMDAHSKILSQWRSHQLSDEAYICEIRKLGEKLK